jgi:hypothetical protein
MGLLHKIAVMASSTAMVAGIGAAGLVNAGPASASPTALKLCVINPINPPDDNNFFCAIDGAADGDLIPAKAPPDSSFTNWYYPDPGTRTIRQLNTDKCMSNDNTIIVVAACSSDDSTQQWEELPFCFQVNASGSVYTGCYFENPATGLCLTEDTGYLEALKCNDSNPANEDIWQTWFALSTSQIP